MKVVGLVSGGKDSCYAMMKCIEYDHEIVALANLLPVDDSLDELDSYMYQTVGHQVVVSYASCMGVPLFRRRIQGSTRHHKLSYSMTPGDEVEDLFILLKEVKRQIPSIVAVSSGAIASDYQRLRVENVCSRLGLISLAYLWKQDQSLLLQEMIRKGILAIIVKVAAIGLDPRKHLGKEIAHLESYLHKLKELYGINVCGEGGEYESLTLDCPLFKNARLVLDKFDIVLHSSDSIAPVGILHPLAFHLESKLVAESLSDGERRNGIFPENMVAAHEVLGDCLQRCEVDCQSVDHSFDLAEVAGHKLHISRTGKDNIFSISCWFQDSCKTSADLQEDLRVVLMKIELQLVEYGLSWGNVLYIHLYIADMCEFAKANETYVRFITQDKCKFGVPSRSTIELPLLQVGLGRAYIEVLVANDQSKRVLHVQSISCWAPSCIGPYSQATLHKQILHMAGQLGLDPPTMSLCSGGPAAELEQALQNSEAVAKCFHCSISTSAILFIIYCSAYISLSEKISIQDKLDTFLKQMKVLNLCSENKSEVLDPIVLYVLVPDLPKRASVEVKPILYAVDDTETNTGFVAGDTSSEVAQSFWGFGHQPWHQFNVQKCIVRGNLCAAILSVTDDLVMKICPECAGANQDDGVHPNILTERKMDRIAKFCIFLIDRILSENHFSWDDATNLRFYYPTCLLMSHESLSLMFSIVFNEFAEMTKRIQISKEPIFTLIPVLGAGRSATSMDDVITCELFAQKSFSNSRN
ncbi:diphthine--ammonia ligase isoform X2 [Actinidia eriantha]|uniref:diphthine--ammonia ligase isoform X2 n=1 Tax=Actinidia eriantha TaxID=165200 RepID=UPI00258602D1|nr:diphthine--ammonia ligase isoform X2 [Actinidia eriantha]